MPNDEITMARIVEEVMPTWEVCKLQRLKNALEMEIVERLMAGRRTRKPKRERA